MHIVHVHIHVNEEAMEKFIQACVENARNSIREPGVVRFDVIQQKDDPDRFTLVEIYQTPDDQARHRETEHYQVWKDTVAGMMAEPRQAVIYQDLYMPQKNLS